MRLIFILILLVLNSPVFAQTLNKLGKIESYEFPEFPDFKVERIGGKFKIFKDSFQFDGNTFFEIPNGFITCLQFVGNEKDYIKHYSSEGVLLVTILSDKIINLKISDKGNKLVFNNSENIIFINLNGYKIDTLADSYVYEFVRNEDLIYYDPDKKSIYFKNLCIESEQYPNQFIEFRDKIIVITKQCIYELIGNSLFSRYEFKGEFFDAKIMNDEFYFVDKEEKRKSRIVSLYKTSDFSKIILVDRIDELNR